MGCVFKLYLQTEPWWPLVSDWLCLWCYYYVLLTYWYKINNFQVYIDVGRGELEIEIESLVFTGDDTTRTDGELFCLYLVLFISNKPILMLIQGLKAVWCVDWRKELFVEIQFCNRTSMTVGKLLNVSLVYLVCFIIVLIWNNWYEGIDWCWPSTTWNVNWFFGFHWRCCETNW